MVQSRIHNMTSGLGRSCHDELEFWGILQQIGTSHFAYSHFTYFRPRSCILPTRISVMSVMSRQHPEVGSCQSDILCLWLALSVPRAVICRSDPERADGN